MLENTATDIDQSNYDVALVTVGKPITGYLAKLSMEGKWVLVYGDKKNAVFIRKNTYDIPQFLGPVE